ncbi:MAG TPA: ATP-binding protein [Thermodesulfobacteriota bacterium]|nr:ATP-binding protein [Thermodesulfobacteriota bacterium]
MAKLSKSKAIGCGRCYEKGYIVEKRGTLSVARTCTCVQTCKECNGSGSILAKNNKGYTYIDVCKACGQKRRNTRLYNLAGIPAKYYQVLEAGTFQPKHESHWRALNYAKDFVKLYHNPDTRKRGFLLMGRSGLGKTHLAIGTIAELTLEYGIRCMFKDFFYLLSELREAYSQGTPENEVIMPLIETEVLVIDELGKGKSSEWESNILDQLISKRYNAEKVTLITTNFISKDYATEEDREILEEKVGERVASRLREMCEFIYLKGEDHRKSRRSRN